MNTRREEALALARSAAGASAVYESVDVGIAPPFLWCAGAVECARGTPLAVYAQNAAWASKGAFTGETSPDMIVEAGLRGAILGHSERRHLFGESNEEVGKKVALARAAGCAVILCVGETLEEREQGSTMQVVGQQLSAGLEGLSSSDSLAIAYEPVWAIGTGVTATPEEAQEIHAQIRELLADRFGSEGRELRIQYGGSVKSKNAADLLAMPDIDGALIGGASLKATEFRKIIEIAAKR